MKINNILMLGAMFGVASLASASTSFTFGSLNGVPTGSGGNYLGPYTGTLNGQTVSLYCDDYADHVNPGNTYNVNLTLVSSIIASPGSYTSTVRFANTAAQNGLTMPSGTNIYQEVAWLLTQETHYNPAAGAGSTADAIQDAIWELTESGNQASISNSNYAADLTGSHNSALNPYFWATLANNKTNLTAASNSTYSYAGTSITLYAADYTTWEVIDQATGLGAVGGSNQYQELLTQVSSTQGTQVGSAPEPGTFALIGGAFVAVAFRKRRKA